MSENTYKAAGVDLVAGEEATRRIAKLAKSTFTPNVVREVGLFGGFFQLDLAGYENPVMVSSVDGVGTKLKIAFQMDKHDTIGECLVNHCVNDIMTSGAKPLYFLDYVGTGKLKPDVVADIVSGLARGCQNAGSALIGGETAEMPGFYSDGEYDIAGTIVGIVDKSKIIDGSQIKKGDVLLGVPSTGLHTNGFSLARKILSAENGYPVNKFVDELGTTVGEALLAVHRSYQNLIELLLDQPYLAGMSHITGGGIIGNTKRVLPEGLSLDIFWENWEVPPLFKLMQQVGNVSDDEMRQVFNMGIGYIFIVGQESVENAISILNQKEDCVYIVGEVA